MVDENVKFDAIANKISELTGYARDQMRLDTRVYHDAGLAGLDFQEFLTWFSIRYRVNLSGLQPGRLAPAEGSALGSLWPKRYVELTIQDFIQLSNSETWAASGLSKRRPK